MKNNIPPLQPITSQWIHSIADNYDLQKELIDTYESPLNIHHLESFKTKPAFKFMIFIFKPTNSKPHLCLTLLFFCNF